MPTVAAIGVAFGALVVGSALMSDDASGGPNGAPVDTSGTAETSSTSSTTLTPSPTINYIELPTVAEWLPISVSAPVEVLVGQSFRVDVRCDSGWAGAIGEVHLFSTPNASPPPNLDGVDFTESWAQVPIDGSGRFSATYAGAPTPQTAYIRASCALEVWESDVLQPDGSGGYNVYHYRYPQERMLTVRFVTELSAPTATIPPTV